MQMRGSRYKKADVIDLSGPQTGLWLSDLLAFARAVPSTQNTLPLLLVWLTFLLLQVPARPNLLRDALLLFLRLLY